MRPERGFGLVAAMFLIIVIAAVIMVMARLATTQNATNDMSLQQARAYQAARAGMDWAINRATNGQACSGAFTPPGFDGFNVAVACVTSAGTQLPEENDKIPQFFRITSTAQFGVPGGADYTYRQLTAVVEWPP